MRRLLVIVAFAPLVAGCASYSWYRPGVPPEIAARDGEECRQQAAYLVNAELMAYDPLWPGSTYWGWGPTFPVSGLAMEQDVFRRCMHFKGYELVRDPEPVSGRRSHGP